ncbi:(2Fe-2S) ferredoxin domain-containing protein [Bacteroidales bacterium]|nr:(2Fe-2S) ferredoxin domain-containing protein [Bacteroidales bacterium]
MEKKIKTLADLKKLQDDVKNKVSLREKSDDPEKLVQIKVAMATCCIASGSRETMNFLVENLDKRNIESVVTQTGCMGYCHSEPTIEVKLPEQEAVVFGNVDTARADEIIEKYIKQGELVEGILPVNYNNASDAS